MKRIEIYAVLIFITAALVGCSRQAAELNTFMLETKQVQGVSALQSQKVMRIGGFGASSPFKYKYFVYRVSEFEFETDYYNQFLVRPEEMVVEHVYNWFSSRDMFRDIVRWDSMFVADYELSGHVVSLYGDFRDKAPYVAVMEIEFTFADVGSEKAKVVFEKTYRTESQFDSEDVRELVRGYGKCLEGILDKVEADISELDLSR
jgi:ABC-type uncharacterized transport system auxiliary subunit